MHRPFTVILLAASLAFPPAVLTMPASPALAQESPADAQARTLIKQSDDLYDTRRHEAGVPNQIKQLLEQAVKLQGERYDTTWRLARIYWWMSDGETDKGRIEALTKQGWSWGDKAVKFNPNGVEGNFWLSVNIGSNSLAVGVVRALANGLESRFLEPLDKSIKINKRFADSGPLRTRGTYHMNLPWPKRDLPKAIALFQESLKLDPRGVRSRWYLAEAYEKNGDNRAALVELDKILNADPRQVDPCDLARIQKWAKAKKLEIQGG